MSVTNAWERFCPGQCVAVPPLSKEFEDIAAAYGISLDLLVKKLLFQAPLPELPLLAAPGVFKSMSWVCGHGLNDPLYAHRGPRRPYVGAIIGKCLGRSEALKQCQMQGDTGMHLRNALQQVGLADSGDIYVTNLLKTQPLIPGKFPKTWLKAQWPFLMLELLLTKPDYALLLGNDVIKAFLGNAATLKDLEGRWVDWKLDMRLSPDEEERVGENVKIVKMLPCLNPAALEYEQKMEDKARLVDGCRLFAAAVRGEASFEPPKLPDYPVVSDMVSLKSFMDRMADEAVLRLVGTDAEWQGDHPQNRNAFLRCLQLGWKEGNAIVVSLTNQLGEPTFLGWDGRPGLHARNQCFDLIYSTFKRARLRVAGFFFQADDEWLSYFGLKLIEFFEAAESPELMRTEGGFGLDLAANAVDELSRIDLDNMRWRYTNIPAYKHVLQQYRKHILTAAKRLDEELSDYLEEGFGWLPDEILYPYAGADADVTHTASVNIMQHLDSDRFGLNCWQSLWRSQQAAPVACEIMQVGMPFDPQRCCEQALVYHQGFQRVLAETRRKLNWPDWNPKSPRQVVEALYGHRYSSKRDDSTGEPISVRPMGARTFNLEPVLNNDNKSPKLWTEIREEGQELLHTPGTNAKNIGMIVKDPEGIAVRRYSNLHNAWLIERHAAIDGIESIRQLRALNQVQANFVGIPVLGEDGRWRLVGGYNSVVCDDGYVRCLISMVKETGRWSASGPNLHALPKKTEPFYKEILKKLYFAKIRSMFKAPPGYVIIESDYSSAEMFMLAIASGDRVLWDHCQRGLLPETDPQFVDIHSTVSVTGLGLKCAPTKDGLKSIQMEHIRDVTKCVAEGELLAMSNGWVPVEKVVETLGGGQTAPVEPGTVFLQSDRFLTPLLAVHASGVKECFSVKSTLGYEIVASADHRHYVLRASGELEFVATRDLRTDDHLLLSPTLPDSDSRWKVPDELAACLKQAVSSRSGRESVSQDICTLLGVLAAVVHRKGWEIYRGEFLRLHFGSDMPVNSERMLSITELFERFVETPGSVRVLRLACGDSAIELRDAYVTELVRQAAHTGWQGVPERVLRWPKLRREQFLAGFLRVVSRGSCRMPAAVEEPALARLLQQLALASGVLLRREFLDGADGPLCILRPADGTSRKVWESVLGGADWKSFKLTTVGDRRVPNIARYLARAIRYTHLEESDRIYATRRECLELCQAAEHRADYLEPDQRVQLRRIHDFLASQLLADKIESVTSVGSKPTYDFETSPERRHVVFYGGVASHNSVVYGWAYGRQAKAIVIGVREQGIIIDIEQALAIVQTLTELYPDAAGFLEAASQRVQDGYLVTPLGRIRRAPDSTHKTKLAGYEREFKNAPIQGGVADVVNVAAYNLRKIRRERGLSFRIALQMHDAFYFLVPYHEVEVMCNEVIPEGMVKRVPIVPFRLDGSRRTDLEPAYMGCGLNVYFRWGEKPTRDQLLDVGIDPKRIKRLE